MYECIGTVFVTVLCRIVGLVSRFFLFSVVIVVIVGWFVRVCFWGLVALFLDNYLILFSAIIISKQIPLSDKIL